uniref:Uncharacterized protein n=1 Tax=Rhizophora mucronata TaxID=61149 RepID=A0A2P2NXE1_RHIMU
MERSREKVRTNGVENIEGPIFCMHESKQLRNEISFVVVAAAGAAAAA